MTVDNPGVITPAKLRSGAPDALAALCRSRGAAVFAYCQRAVGRDDAAALAAEAFAQLRIAILPQGSLTNKDQAEQLLRSVSRRTALAHLVDTANPPDSGECADRDTDLLSYVGRILTAADRKAVAAHVGRCHRCSELLRRLEAAEVGFDVRPGTPLPAAVAREILTALACAAPVRSHHGDATAVRDEALLLLDGAVPGADDSADEPVAPKSAPPEPPTSADEPPSARAAVDQPPAVANPNGNPTARPDVSREPSPRPAVQREPGGFTVRDRLRSVSPPAALITQRDSIDRLRVRVAWPRRRYLGPRRSHMLLRGVARFMAIILVAGGAGTLLGLGIPALIGNDGAPKPAAPAPSAKLVAPDSPVVDVLSTTVHSFANGSGEGSRVSVEVRIQNTSGNAVRVARPALLAGDARVGVAPAIDSTDAALLAPTIAAGATAKGTLDFELESTAPSALISAPVRLRIAGKVVALNPVVGAGVDG